MKIKIHTRTERNKLIKQECYHTTKALIQKQIEYQMELEARLTLIKKITQMQVNELASKIKETIKEVKKLKL